uniref:Ribonuclease H2 subunit B n=1 Tax=Strigamia maritima TaxID=126957 RepID=T1JC34_STRMM
MPRKSPRKSSSKQNKALSDKGSKQVVIILPAHKILDGESKGNLTFAQLRHPKTDDGALYSFDDNNKIVCEVLKYKENPQSCFLGNSVEPDGSMHVCTEINTLFLALPYFIKSNKFGLLDQVLHDDEFPAVSRLTDCITSKQLMLITDSKSIGNDTFYRFNKENTLNWLKKRTEKVAAVLEEQQVHVTKGARSATFVRSKNDEQPEKSDYLKYACGLISEYMSRSLSEDLHKHLNLEFKSDVSPVAEPPAKRAKMEKKGEPTEDYSDKKEVKLKTQCEVPPIQLLNRDLCYWISSLHSNLRFSTSITTSSVGIQSGFSPSTNLIGPFYQASAHAPNDSLPVCLATVNGRRCMRLWIYHIDMWVQSGPIAEIQQQESTKVGDGTQSPEVELVAHFVKAQLDESQKSEGSVGMRAVSFVVHLVP